MEECGMEECGMGNVEWGNVEWENVEWENVEWENVEWENVEWGNTPDNSRSTYFFARAMTLRVLCWSLLESGFSFEAGRIVRLFLILLRYFHTNIWEFFIFFFFYYSPARETLETAFLSVLF